MAADGVVPRYETVDGLRVRYVRKGSGPPVLLLHGFSSSIYTWKDVLPVLAAAGHDVIAMDLPGFGGSDIPDSLDGQREVRAVVGLLDALRIERVSIAGNSLGGALAVGVAARQPARVGRLVLIDSAGYNFASTDRPWMLRVVAATPAWTARVLPIRPMVTLSLKQVFHDDRLVTPDRVDEYVAPLRRPGAAEAGRQLLRSGRDMDFPEAVRRVKAPTLVIWGRYDEWIPLRDAQRFAADIPGARVAVVESGHMPQEERPAETAALIAPFLAAARD